MEIRYGKNGIANNYGDFIELNENLKMYPQLHDRILKHELEHSQDKGFTKKDFILDLTEDRVSNWEMLKFGIKHPRAFMQLLPFYWKEGIIYYDINMILVYSVIGTIGLIAFLLAWY